MTVCYFSDYRKYVKEIEKEYCHMAEETFNSGRAKVSTYVYPLT